MYEVRKFDLEMETILTFEKGEIQGLEMKYVQPCRSHRAVFNS